MRFYHSILLISLSLSSLHAARLKDLTKIRGMKENQLLGYGLVVGLPGTGDRGGNFTEGSLNLALKGLGVDVKNQQILTKNTAAVVVTALVPPFSKLGNKLDITVASIGSASSLEGGTLMMTPLKAADGKIYAIAQGRIAVTKLSDRTATSYQGMLSSSVTEGAILEKEVSFSMTDLSELKFHLNHPDFTTAARIAHKINEELSGKFAESVDPATVTLNLPYMTQESIVELIAKLESLEVEPDRIAKVIVNKKTGSVVLGEHVKLFPISIAQNNLKIQIREDVREPMSEPIKKESEAVVFGETNLPPQNPKAPRTLKFSNQGTSIADIVTSLNEIGSTSEDIIFLLQALKSSGSLVADLEIK